MSASKKFLYLKTHNFIFKTTAGRTRGRAVRHAVRRINEPPRRGELWKHCFQYTIHPSSIEFVCIYFTTLKIYRAVNPYIPLCLKIRSRLTSSTGPSILFLLPRTAQFLSPDSWKVIIDFIMYVLLINIFSCILTSTSITVVWLTKKSRNQLFKNNG